MATGSSAALTGTKGMRLSDGSKLSCAYLAACSSVTIGCFFAAARPASDWPFSTCARWPAEPPRVRLGVGPSRVLESAATSLPLPRMLANAGGSSGSIETTTKPNMRKWSMTVRAKGIHWSSRWREKTGLSLTSSPSRRTTTPLLSSWPMRIWRAAWMLGDVWYRCWSATIESTETLTSPGVPASMASSGDEALRFLCPGGSWRLTRLRRSMPELMLDTLPPTHTLRLNRVSASPPNTRPRRPLAPCRRRSCRRPPFAWRPATASG